MRLLLLAILVLFSAAAWGSTGEEILQRMDRNRDYTTSTADATMEIHIGSEVRTKQMTMQSIATGRKSIVEFTNPEDRGTKYLMLGDNLWIYFADEQDVVKISGHLLKEGMMGSDVSYEDALSSDKLYEKYTITTAADDTIDGHACSVVDLQAKVRDVPYYHRKMWVGKDEFIAWKEEMYGKSGKLLKVARVLATQKVGERVVPVKTVMENRLRGNSKTIFTMTHLKIDEPLDELLFSIRYLRR